MSVWIKTSDDFKLVKGSQTIRRRIRLAVSADTSIVAMDMKSRIPVATSLDLIPARFLVTKDHEKRYSAKASPAEIPNAAPSVGFEPFRFVSPETRNTPASISTVFSVEDPTLVLWPRNATPSTRDQTMYVLS